MDECDRAAEFEAFHRQLSLSRELDKHRHDLPSRDSCIDCGDAIPVARRVACPGVETCVSCQDDRELIKRQGRTRGA